LGPSKIKLKNKPRAVIEWWVAMKFRRPIYSVATLMLAFASFVSAQVQIIEDSVFTDTEKTNAQITTIAAPQCIPPCRAGYVCVNGACVSQCNPPCPEGQECTPGFRCLPVLPPAAISRPLELSHENPYSYGAVSLVFACITGALGTAAIIEGLMPSDSGPGIGPGLALGGLSGYFFTVSFRNKKLYRAWERLPAEKKMHPYSEREEERYGNYRAFIIPAWVLYGASVVISALASERSSRIQQAAPGLQAGALVSYATGLTLFIAGNKIKMKHLRWENYDDQ
jgi:hypothetical protein